MSPWSTTSTGLAAEAADATLDNQDIIDIFDSPLRAHSDHSKNFSPSTSPCGVDNDPYQEAETSPITDSEATTRLFDWDHWTSHIENIRVDFQSPEFQHWHWVITADFSQLGPAVQMCSTYLTL